MWRYKTRPLSLSLGVNLSERFTWVLRYLATKNAELTVAHSIRNSIIGTTFFSSSSLLVSWGLLRPIISSAIAQASSLDDPTTVHSIISFVNATNDVKVLALSGVFFAAFLSFAVSVRHFTHISFLLCAFSNKDPDRQTQTDEEYRLAVHRWEPRVKDSVISLMTRATIMYHIGLRCFYTFVPLSLWLLGTPGLFFGTIIYLILLSYNDCYSLDTEHH